jgi:hypothetical protein
MIGVSRPSSKRIIENINNNISFFRNTYASHNFEFVVCTYINEIYNDILKYCEENNIANYFMEPIKDSDIPNELDKYMYDNSPDRKTKNRYRMFYSMNYILNKINSDYDAVIRLRLDTEIKSFEIVDTIKPKVYYTALDINDGCSDNIGYGSYDVMKNTWDLKNCFIKSVNNEALVYNAIKKQSCSIEQFKFHYIMYQSNDEYYDGVKQWSRSNREWIYDGKKYIKGTNLPATNN